MADLDYENEEISGEEASGKKPLNFYSDEQRPYTPTPQPNVETVCDLPQSNQAPLDYSEIVGDTGIRRDEDGQARPFEPGESTIVPGQGAVKTPDAMTDDELGDAVQDEIDILQGYEPDFDYSYDGVSVALLTGTKTLRLLAEGKVPEAGQLLVNAYEAVMRLPNMDFLVVQQRIEALKSRIKTTDPNNQEDMDYLRERAKEIFRLRHANV